MLVGANVNNREWNERYAAGKGVRGGVEQKNDAAQAVPGGEKEDAVDFMDLLKEKKAEIFKKVINGETEPKIQIGSQAFTEKEWDRLLKQFDSAEDAIKEKMREEFAKRLRNQGKKAEAEEVEDKEIEAGKTEQGKKWYGSDTELENMLAQLL